MITTGIDLIKSNRLNNYKHLDKIFTTNELKYLENHKSIDTMAGMFAAKEALLKSLKYGLEKHSFLDIEIVHVNNAPYFNFYGSLKKEIDENNYSFDLSISHDGDYTIASVICYK